ncbi:ABC transporter permease [candidate division KSB1 bacterium]
MTKKKTPSALPKWLLSKLLDGDRLKSTIEDFEEYEIELMKEKGKLRTWLWYWTQVFHIIRGRFFNRMIWSSAMFRNYLKIAIRNILKYKTYSFINISGLAIGLASCVLVLLYVENEYSYDRFHENFERIFRIDRKEAVRSGWKPWIDVSGDTGAWMKQDYPEVENYVRIKSLPLYNYKIRYNEHYLKAGLIEAVDPAFFDIFTFPLIQGNPGAAMADPGSVLLTEEFAQRLFNKEDALGKVITITSEEEDKTIEYDLKVTGILKNIPEKSHSTFSIIVPMEFARKAYADAGIPEEEYLDSGFVTYVLLKNPELLKQLEGKFSEFTGRRFGEEKVGSKVFSLKPLGEIFSSGASEFKMTLFSLIALVILTVACINYMNLSTAKSFSRAREIGIRKVVGAGKLQLIIQFIGEAVVFAITGLILSFILAQLLLPVFNIILQKNLSMTIENTTGIFTRALLMAVGAGVISGIYPAFFLSNFKPVVVLKGKVKFVESKYSVRNILVIFQYAVSIFFIIGSIVINKQFNYFTTQDLGFDTDDIIIVTLDKSRPVDFMENIKSRLILDSRIQYASFATSIPYESLRRLPKDPRLNVQNFLAKAYGVPMIYCDQDYLSALGITLDKGDNFSAKDVSFNLESLIISKAAVDLTGENAPLEPGRKINLKIDENRYKDYNIRGITGDLYFTVKYFDVEPLIFSVASPNQNIKYKYIVLKVRSGIDDEVVSFVSNTISEYSPETVFSHTFFDEYMTNRYDREGRWKLIFTIISAIAIFVTSLGMIGIATYSCEQRVGEVGIRKVLGGSVTGIMGLLSMQFVRLVIIANIIAIPLGCFYMRNYLRGFAYQTSIGLDTVLLALSLSLLLTVVTVIIQVLRTALADPVDSLRYE